MKQRFLHCSSAMKQSVMLVLSFALMTAFVSCDKDDDEPKPLSKQEAFAQKLYGDYVLEGVHWSGLPVDLNRDGTGRWELMDEFKAMLGFYMPDYVTNVCAGKTEEYIEFNFAIPCPHFVLEDSLWVCTEMRTIKKTMTAKVNYLKPYQGALWSAPKPVTGDSDLFVASIKDIEVYTEDADSKKLLVRVHCTMPHAHGDHQLNENYMYFTFKRI